jgi:hypothetical protein
MVAQVVSILLLILGWGPLPLVAPLGYGALWVVMLTSLISAADYYRRFQRMAGARVTDLNVARSRKVS